MKLLRVASMARRHGRWDTNSLPSTGGGLDLSTAIRKLISWGFPRLNDGSVASRHPPKARTPTGDVEVRACPSLHCQENVRPLACSVNPPAKCHAVSSSRIQECVFLPHGRQSAILGRDDVTTAPLRFQTPPGFGHLRAFGIQD